MPHFEIFVADTAAARAFYSGLFGWSFSEMPVGEGMEYFLADGAGIGNGLTVGMMKRMDATPAAGSPVRGGTMTFEVADCDERYRWALDHGGAEAMPPQDFAGIGRCASVEDGQGNIVSMIKPEGDE